MELHVPCCDPLDRLIIMSNYNYIHKSINQSLGDDAFYQSIRKCVIYMNCFNHKFTKHLMPSALIKENNLLLPIDYMLSKLQQRRFVSTPYIKRERNRDQNKTNECIWQHPDLMEKAGNCLQKRRNTNCRYNLSCGNDGSRQSSSKKKIKPI